MDNFYMLVTYTTADLVLQLGTTAASIRWNCGKRLISKCEKAGSYQELNPGHLAGATSVLLLSDDNQTLTSPM